MSADSHEACRCPHPEPGSGLELATRGVGERVGARLNTAAARALMNYCRAHGCNQSEGLRRAIVALAASTQTPADQLLDTLLEVLSLPETASISDIHAKIDQVLAPPPAPDDPLDGGGDAEPAPPKAPPASPTPATRTALSAEQVAALKRRGLPSTAAAWKTLCKSMARGDSAAPTSAAAAPATRALSNADVSGLTDAERSYLSRHPEITREEYLAKKSKSVRRST